MDILNHPIELGLAVVLSVLSLIFCWKGWRDKAYWLLLLGIALGIPPMDMENVQIWIFTALLCGTAFWLRRRFETLE